MRLMPLADGGEGTAEILGDALRAEAVTTQVCDALARPLEACYYLSGDMALIDVAASIGLTLIPENERDVMRATSFGAGQSVAAAWRRGARKIIIGLGGSATCDGGRGMAAAMQMAGIMPGDCEFTVLCDVDNPMCGPSGAAAVFAPQKGASPQQVAELEAQMCAWAAEIRRRTGIDVSGMPRAGAAGGIAGMLAGLYGASLVSGIDYVLDALNFDEAATGADLIITGEGRIDSQTLHGKTISGVLVRAGRLGKPVAALAGSVADEGELESRFCRLRQIIPAGQPLSEAMKPEVAAANLRCAAAELIRGINV